MKKNAILMIDFALAAQRNEHKSPKEAIYEACLLRFRPILMTTMAALLGALPLALGTGTGSELRRPLGITIIGGLIFSQMLTLFTTPVVYLYMDRFGAWWQRSHKRQCSVVPARGGLNLRNPPAEIKTDVVPISNALCFACPGVVLASGCTVGPKYHTPSVQSPAAYKEMTPADFPNTDGWKVAQPSDALCAATGGKCSTIPS